MSKDRSKNVNWEPDIRKGMDTAKNIKDVQEGLKDAADKRKIDGFNPADSRGKK